MRRRAGWKMGECCALSKISHLTGTKHSSAAALYEHPFLAIVGASNVSSHVCKICHDNFEIDPEMMDSERMSKDSEDYGAMNWCFICRKDESMFSEPLLRCENKQCRHAGCTTAQGKRFEECCYVWHESCFAGISGLKMSGDGEKCPLCRATTGRGCHLAIERECALWMKIRGQTSSHSSALPFHGTLNSIMLCPKIL